MATYSLYCCYYEILAEETRKHLRRNLNNFLVLLLFELFLLLESVPWLNFRNVCRVSGRSGNLRRLLGLGIFILLLGLALLAHKLTI